MKEEQVKIGWWKMSMVEFIRLGVLGAGLVAIVVKLQAGQVELQKGQLELTRRITQQEEALRVFIAENSAAHKDIMLSLAATQERTIKRDQEITVALGRVTGILEVILNEHKKP